MECCKIVFGKRGGCRERLKSNGGTIELAIDVIHQALRDLQNTAFGFRFVLACQLIERENRKSDERKGQGERKQDQECPDSPVAEPMVEQSLRHLGRSPSLTFPSTCSEYGRTRSHESSAEALVRRL
jgi:hypothetical protein